MRIAIAGTRGIPNNYGGFEQFAEQLAIRLAERNHYVVVFNPSYHYSTEKSYKNVSIVHIPCRENIIKGAAHFFYDSSCIKYAAKNNIYIVLMCGYGTSAPGLRWRKKVEDKVKVVTNMDGFEWKRAKYNFITKTLLKWFEGIAVRHSDKIVADHTVIQTYYENNYHIKPALISYGANIPLTFNEDSLLKYNIDKYGYYLVVARDEPENQIEYIISEWLESGSTKKLCIATNHIRLSEKYAKTNNIVFLTGMYDYNSLSDIRHFAIANIHGHTVGGTNPSLLEAMASQSFIIAHDNVFHRSILEENAEYFNNENRLASILKSDSNKDLHHEIMIANNLTKIENDYNWDKVCDEYEELFLKL